MPRPTAPATGEDRIVVGVDTHKDVHAAVALSAVGLVIGQVIVSTTSQGIGRLRTWANDLGQVDAWGVEGTGSYGAGLARALMAAGETVVEINRADRRARRLLGGKTDLIDAEAAARAVLADYASTTPKSGTGAVEMIRMTRAARSSAVKARTAAMNQLKAIIVTAPPQLRDPLERLGSRTLITRCAAMRPGSADTTEAAVRRTLRALARRWRALDDEVREHTVQLSRLVTAAAPQLLAPSTASDPTAQPLCSSPPGQPPPAAQRIRVRRPLRHQPDPGQLG